jgi:proteasome regulatory subunit
MNKVNVAQVVEAMEGFSGAEIKSVVTEAGYFAIREGRNKVTEEDFLSAVEKVTTGEPEDTDYTAMFG